MEKMCILEIPDHIYNWLVNYFHQRGHITNYQGLMSRLAHINASIVQGLVISPASYVVEASGLHPRNPRNVMSKFADDTYLLVGSKHLGTAGQELQHVTKWAESNNLRLNLAKTKELIVFRKGVSRDIPNTTIIERAERVTSMRVLGVTISSDLSMEVH